MKLFSEISFIVKESFFVKRIVSSWIKHKIFCVRVHIMGLDTSNLLKSDFQKYIIKSEESVVDLMSMDYGGSARLVLQDEKTAIYEYSPYDLNKIEYRNNERIYDGLITISKDGL